MTRKYISVRYIVILNCREYLHTFFFLRYEKMNFLAVLTIRNVSGMIKNDVMNEICRIHYAFCSINFSS